MIRPLLALLLAGAIASPVLAATAPRITSAANFNTLPQPLPAPYDEGANAEAALKGAIARAKAKNKLVLLDLGGNWCPDCRILAAVMDLPELKRFLASKYEVVLVDIGRYDRNMQIPARYGITRPKGVPSVLMIDPRTNKLINEGKTTALADARSMTPQALADWLASWAR